MDVLPNVNDKFDETEISKYITTGLVSNLADYYRPFFFDELEMPLFEPKLMSEETYNSFVQLKKRLTLTNQTEHDFSCEIRKSVPSCIDSINLKSNNVTIDIMLEHQNSYSNNRKYIGITSDLDIHINKIKILSNYLQIFTLDHSERTKIQKYVHNEYKIKVYENPFVFAVRFTEKKMRSADILLNRNTLNTYKIGISGSILNELNRNRYQQLKHINKHFKLTAVNGFMESLEYIKFIRNLDIVFCPSRNVGTILTRALEAIGNGRVVLVENNSIMKVLFPNSCFDFNDLNKILADGDEIHLDCSRDYHLLKNYSEIKINYKFFSLIECALGMDLR